MSTFVDGESFSLEVGSPGGGGGGGGTFPFVNTLNMATRLQGTSQDIKNMHESRGPIFDIINKDNSFHVNTR